MNNNKYNVNLNTDQESSIIISTDVNTQIIEYNIKLITKILDKIYSKFCVSIKINFSHIKQTQCINEAYKEMLQKYNKLINEILPNLKKSNNILDILLHTKIKTILSSTIYLNDTIHNILNLFINSNFQDMNDIVVAYKENIEYVFNKIKDNQMIDFGYNLYNDKYAYDGTSIKKRKNCDESVINESFIDEMFSDISKYCETKNNEEKTSCCEKKFNDSCDLRGNNNLKEIVNKCIIRISDVNDKNKITNKIKNNQKIIQINKEKNINTKDLFSKEINLNRKNNTIKKDTFLNKFLYKNQENVLQHDKKFLQNKIINNQHITSCCTGNNLNLKNIYIHEELENILNIKTINFSDLPQNVVKVAEASFSEVFKYKSHIYKIIPLDDKFTKITDFYKECFIHKILSCEEGICPLIDIFLVKGQYTKRYLQAWDNFGFEENERPDKHNFFGVIVSENGGACLEKYKFKTVKQILFFVRKIIKILGNLEIKYNFEHRDLHWGNILIKNENISIIDFTLSRITCNKIVYNNLDSKDWLFTADGSVDEQFDVYKMMKKECQNKWHEFFPKTNIFWINYLINKMFTRIDINKSKVLKQKLIEIVLKYNSCSEIKDIELEKLK